MATVEQILAVNPHLNADRLELIQILGYQVVAQKGLYQVGDLIAFVQPDNILPIFCQWADEYRKYAPNRIKALKLRSEWSEGLIIPLSVLTQCLINRKREEIGRFPEFYVDKVAKGLGSIGPDGNMIEVPELSDQDQTQIQVPPIGTDVSRVMGITHYEPPVVNDGEGGGGQTSGVVLQLPFGIPRTDEPRFETIRHKIPFGQKVDVSLKIDGQSFSAYYYLPSDKFGVLGRRLEYACDPKAENYVDNKYTQQIARYDLENKLRAFCQKHDVSLCIRGESYGKGIQNFAINPHCKLENGLAIFSVYVIEGPNIGRYAHKGDKFYFVNLCQELGLPCVPILETDVELTPELLTKYSTDINVLPNGDPFEGAVLKGIDFTCKVINKSYDSKK